MQDRICHDHGVEDHYPILLRAARTQWLRRVLGVAAICFLVFAISAFALGGMVSTAGLARAAIPLGFLAFVVMVGSLFWQRRLHCPACRQRLFDRFGPFCPECGSRSLGPPNPCDLVPIHPCAACARTFRWGKGAKVFKIRYCSLCGVLLDAQGLEMP